MLLVCMCARFQANPKEIHIRALKRIMRDLVYTPKFGLWYPKGSTFDLIGYSDVDYAGCEIDQKSTSGTCQFLWRSLVSWASKKQNSVALLTTEYIAVGHLLGRRRRRHPSLEAFAAAAGLTETKRAGTPFAGLGTLTKACGDVFPRRGLVQSQGPRVIWPIVTGPAWPPLYYGPNL
jgi:hypothetical protein